MENLTDVLDDLTNLEINEDEQRRLEQKYRHRTQSEINQPYYMASKFIRNISQLLSIILALGLVLLMADKFPSIKYAIAALTVFLLIVWECFKRYSIDKQNEIRVINKTKSIKLSGKLYFGASIVLLSGSMAVSYFGAPCIIDKLSQHEPLAILDSVRAEFKASIAANEFKYAAQKKEVKEQIKQIEDKMAWRGTIIKSAQSTYANLQSNAEKKDSLLNDENGKITDAMNNAVLSAVSSNREIIKEHKEFCNSFGWFACIMAIALDILVIVLSFFMAEHEDRKRKENKVKKELLKEVKEDCKYTVKQANRGNDAITYYLQDGTEKTVSIGKFMNYFKNSSKSRKRDLKPYFMDYYNSSTQERKEELKGYLDILELEN